MPNSCPPSIFSHILSIIQSLLTPAIIIIGWFILNRQNNKREDRKEIRAALDKLSHKITLIEERAISFHSGVNQNDLTRAQLVGDIKRIASEVTATKLFKESDYLLIIELRRSITLRKFEQSSIDGEQCAIDREVIENIGRAIEDLIARIEERYREVYHG